MIEFGVGILWVVLYFLSVISLAAWSIQSYPTPVALLSRILPVCYSQTGASHGLDINGTGRQYRQHGIGFTIGSVAIAVAIAFGFGGKDAARTITDSWAAKVIK